ncbi:DUF397 domain-containing protein [Streptomyces sp. 3MP-14]|uniref:DUF397 domain-containing protein n=1 Tax=Streptomyces mimosae TaxID=2586635 RepID=A0A5N6AAQ6_9ACTN|nr:DUF397 domain-containing protein [Streptomyces mimosae]KAB8176296.1 DUF397 domain-containing protein [Streptomyces sp. 3MP-14]
MGEHPTGPWRKSSYSGGNGDCLEVAATRTGRAVRDSKMPAAPVLTFPASQWRVLLAHLSTD